MALLSEYVEAAFQPHTDRISKPKRHAACDECRHRKLKCSGELTGCLRCEKQSLLCNYSIQKQMGRPPKKRLRIDDEGVDFAVQSKDDIWLNPDGLEQLSAGYTTSSNAIPDSDHLCPVLYWRPGCENSPHSQSPDIPLGRDNHNHSSLSDRLKQPNLPVFPTSSPWPDFTTVSEATAMPLPFPHPAAFAPMGNFPLSPATSISSDSSASSCSCLASLYLNLSQMSALPSFPVGDDTLCSLYIAARTARDVIRCDVCPKTFATCVQNTMFTGTLLTVLADAWMRVSKADAAKVGQMTAPADYVTKVLEGPDPARAWKIWLHKIVRRAVTGGYIEPESTTACSRQPDLLSMITEVEKRQRRWHEPGQHPLFESNSAQGHGWPQSDPGLCRENEYLCLQVVGSARNVIANFNFDASDYPEGVEPVTAAHVGP
ncbi:hypothetical protein N7535_002261 [Penicillium sp. DV-2018c]|nr:hypothetical protein N7461_004496 [Penicillium sp. DV-2018c]KAJ5583641.1 hypothetical protein N7535_002261 [Penicillium sp. DV-2018c]